MSVCEVCECVCVRYGMSGVNICELAQIQIEASIQTNFMHLAIDYNIFPLPSL